MPKTSRDQKLERSGNFVSEWFGYRVYPSVADLPASLQAQQQSLCPFLSAATAESRLCVKPESSAGICTISSGSNGPRQDWLVCPYRALDKNLFAEVARRLFSPQQDVLLIPAPSLRVPEIRQDVTAAIAAGVLPVVYFQAKLGGEISLSATDRSPELSFDTTMLELVRSAAGVLSVGRYGIFEVQTMDFHGSYRQAVKNLKDALRLHGQDFPREIGRNPKWLGERIEGPNIANVFKRTFYQMMLKFKIGEHRLCAGCAIAIPKSVWDSWQRHLGKPDLSPGSAGTMNLIRPGQPPVRSPAWIYVFDVAAESSDHPNPIKIDSIIATDAESIAEYALRVVPDAAVAEGGSADRILLTVQRRLAAWWPEIIDGIHL